MFKKFIAFALSIGLAVVLSIGTVHAETELTKEQIAQRFEEINAKYDIGEPFTPEDAEFVKKYATPANTNGVSPMKTDTFYVTGSSGPISGNISGSVTANHGVMTNSWGANFTTTVTKGTPTSIKNTVSHTAYGLIGSGGIGKVYSNTLSATCKNTKSCKLADSEKYSASVAYSYTVPKGTIYYSGGSLGIVYQ